MNWPAVIWSMVAAACLTMAAVHLLVWLRNRKAWASFTFSSAASAVAGIAFLELSAMNAQTPEALGALMRWARVPILVVSVALVAFVLIFLRAGRPWLGHASWIARLVVVVITFSGPVPPANVEITDLRNVDFLGQRVTLVEATPGSWPRRGEIASLLLLAFVLDASISCWRRGDRDSRRKALTVGGSIAGFILASSGHAALLSRGLVESPFFISFPFMGIVMAMGYELTRDVLRAGELSRELSESTQRLELAVHAGGLHPWTWNVRDDSVWGSENFASLFGFGSGERIDFAALFSRIHPDDRAAAAAVMRGALETRAAFEVEFRAVAPDGTERWVSAMGKATLDDRGRPALLRGVAIDVTERKRLEERFRLVVEGAPIAILVTDARGRIVLVNPRAEAVFGYVADEMLGKTIDLLVPDRVTKKHLEHRAGYVKAPAARAMGAGRELAARRKDGTEVPVEVALTPIRTREGLHVLASVVDISDRRRAEAEIESLRSEVAHAGRISMM
ncbi:MAG: PAS domain S-box protein, partial [Vicinamibacteria bacterium]